jgi:hypothetical protein
MFITVREDGVVIENGVAIEGVVENPVMSKKGGTRTGY